MNQDQIERNLQVFLDPPCRVRDDEWLYVRHGISGDASASDGNRKKPRFTIHSFTRKALPQYFICLLAAAFGQRRGKVRKVLYLNDGLLSCIFDSGKTKAYRAYAGKHLSPKSGILRRFAAHLPPMFYAERRFVAIDNSPELLPGTQDNIPGQFDFMFFSNSLGKLIMTNMETFVSGRGLLLKTSATPEYVRNLEKEYEIVKSTKKLHLRPGHLPESKERINANGRLFFSEDYMFGENLRKKLLALGRAKSRGIAILLLDSLDNWFMEWHSAFAGERCLISSLYKPALHTFGNIYAENPVALSLSDHLEKYLEELDGEHEGLVPVIAHNDLWPGNFILGKEQLTAVDWERATEQAAPLFDYYWMIISAVLAYREGCNNVENTSVAFRQFLDQSDEVCGLAHKKLKSFISRLGFDEDQHHQFMLLFLMEWSIQGSLAFGKPTDNDRLAFAEMTAYFKEHQDEFHVDMSCADECRLQRP